VQTNAAGEVTALVVDADPCSGDVTFTPQERGAFGGVVTLSPQGFAQETEVGVTGTGVQGELTAAPDVLSIGEVPVGGTGTESVTVTNSGDGPVTITGVSLEQAVGSGLSIADASACTGGALAVGDSCQVEVVFAAGFDASFRGEKGAVVTVASDAANGELQVPVTATGTRAEIDVSPNPVEFTDTLSDSKTVTVKNPGEAPLVVDASKVAVTGDDAGLFSVALGCSGTVEPGGSCTMTVRFAGEDEGSFAAALVIPSNAQVPTGGGKPDPAKVALSASTPNAVLTAKNTSFPVTGVGSAATQTVTVVNEGDSATTVTAVAVDGEGFRLTNSDDECSGKRLGAGDECEVGIRFKPTSADSAAADLQVTRKGQSGPDSFGLSGKGAFPVMSAPVEDFGPVPVGTTAKQKVKVTNTGEVPLELNKVKGYKGEFGKNRDKCRKDTLAPKESCFVQVLFTPNQVGPRSTTITAVMNTAAAKERIALTGYGTQPVVTAGPVDFGDREVGTVTTKTAVIANTGDAPLRVEEVSVVDEKGRSRDEFDVKDASDCTDRAVKRRATCDIEVRFFPRDDTQSAALLKLTSNAAGSPNSVAVSGTGYTVITPEEVPSGPNGDHDGDGIPNKDDPDYQPNGDHDGDGIPNKDDPDYLEVAEVLVPPGPVKNLKAPAKKRTTTKFTATWQKAKKIGSAQPDGYLTRITKKGTSKKTSRAKKWTKWKTQDWVPAPNGKLSKKFKKLSPNSTYTVQVRAHNIAGNGKKTTIKVTTNRKGLPKKYGTG
ncbi:MAG: choice-of-anchor D domain-containing protein, partial [Actinomycetia bacterium]|nr:choice-of-anchor D domain-containing protein [Actinomycetes bacterium]